MSPHSHLIEEIFKLSQCEIQNFPFCLVAINLTGLILDSVRQGHLNPCLNRIRIKQGTTLHDYEFLAVCGKVLVALLFEFYKDWKANGRTVQDFGVVLKELDKVLKKSPRHLCKKLEAYLHDQEVDTSCTKSKNKSKKEKEKEKDAGELEFSIIE